VLETFACDLTQLGKEDTLDLFDDGRDNNWRRVSIVTDANVLRQVFYNITTRADPASDLELLEVGKPSL
jgi:acyl-CoA reductase-like NAD-dependent aldehyde dehydrogenase